MTQPWSLYVYIGSMLDSDIITRISFVLGQGCWLRSPGRSFCGLGLVVWFPQIVICHVFKVVNALFLDGYRLRWLGCAGISSRTRMASCMEPKARTFVG